MTAVEALDQLCDRIYRQQGIVAQHLAAREAFEELAAGSARSADASRAVLHELETKMDEAKKAAVEELRVADLAAAQAAVDELRAVDRAEQDRQSAIAAQELLIENLKTGVKT